MVHPEIVIPDECLKKNEEYPYPVSYTHLKLPTTSVQTEIIPPTEVSIPPVIITSSIPTDTIASMTFPFNTFIMFVAETNELFTHVITIMSATTRITSPISLLFKKRFIFPAPLPVSYTHLPDAMRTKSLMKD